MPEFESEEDRAAQAEVAGIMERVYDCDVVTMGRLSEVDFMLFCETGLLAVAEMKGRKNASTRYPTVYMSVRKWDALDRWSRAMCCQPLFVARFTDGVMVARVDDTTRWRVTHFTNRKIIRCKSDQEPVFEVPIADMRLLHRF